MLPPWPSHKLTPASLSRMFQTRLGTPLRRGTSGETSARHHGERLRPRRLHFPGGAAEVFFRCHTRQRSDPKVYIEKIVVKRYISVHGSRPHHSRQRSAKATREGLESESTCCRRG